MQRQSTSSHRSGDIQPSFSRSRSEQRSNTDNDNIFTVAPFSTYSAPLAQPFINTASENSHDDIGINTAPTSNNSIRGDEAIRKRKRGVEQVSNSMHKKLKLLARGQTANETPVAVTGHASNKRRNHVQLTYFSWKRFQVFYYIPVGNRHSIGPTVFSALDTTSASRNRPDIEKPVIRPTYPSKGYIQTIPHHIPYEINCNARKRLFNSNEYLTDAHFSPKVIEQRLRDANASSSASSSSSSSSSSLDARERHDLRPYGGHIIWPCRVGDSFKDDKVMISSLSLPVQHMIYLVALQKAAADNDQQTIREYYGIHYTRLRCILNRNDAAKIQFKTWARKAEHVERILMARRLAYKTERRLKGEVKYWHTEFLNACKVAHAFERSSEHGRRDERDAVELLEKWEETWTAMGGVPTGCIGSLREQIKRGPRWAHRGRGWTGLTEEDVPLKGFRFVSIDGVFRKTCRADHGRGLCAGCIGRQGKS